MDRFWNRARIVANNVILSEKNMPHSTHVLSPIASWEGEPPLFESRCARSY